MNKIKLPKNNVVPIILLKGAIKFIINAKKLKHIIPKVNFHKIYNFHKYFDLKSKCKTNFPI